MTTKHRLRRAAAVLAAGALIPLVATQTGARAAGDAGAPDQPLTPKSLVVGVDGAMYDVWDGLDLPTFESLVETGSASTFNLFADPMAPTSSGPAWSTIATGAWPDKHKVVDNSFAGNDFATFPDYLSRLEATDPNTSTLVVGTWGPVPQQVFTGADDRVSGGNDADTTARAAELLENGDPDATFVHLDEVDGAGHRCGWDCPAYATELADVDEQIGTLLAAVENRSTRAQESWQVIVTTDHGHTAAGGHGGDSPDERQAFVLTVGPGVTAGEQRHDVKLVDIAATTLDHFGVSVDAGWRLDGKPLADLTPDDFDTVRPRLQTQVDETGPGPDTLGWTHEAPQGWSIDNSAMPAGGVTELRGWTFATDEFWTNIERGQKRETSVRMRDVFAVADSDEWDDEPHDEGAFDSTLVSPAYPVDGDGRVEVSYATNYQWDGSTQLGQVLAVWDGAEPVLVKEYGDSHESNTNAVERLHLNPPAGATSLQLRFRYLGTNSYFWTLDQVQVQQREPSQLAVARIDATATSVDEPGEATPWRVNAEVKVTTADGQPAVGANVHSRLVFGDRTTTLRATSDARGIAAFRAYAHYADQATFEVTDVELDGVPYYGERNTITSVTLDRPLEAPRATLSGVVPAISGRTVVGGRVKAHPGDWGAGVTLSYQWHVGGNPVPGATARGYVPRARDLGRPLAVQVTGRKREHHDRVVTSASVVVGKGRLTGRAPKITGTVKVGRTLVAHADGWRPTPVGVAYRWFADGKPIAGARKAELPVASSLRGKRITVTVTARRAGYAKATRTSRPTKRVR